MKNQVLLLTVLVGYISGAVVKPEEAVDTVQVFDSFGEVEPASIKDHQVIVGEIRPGDRLLHWGFYSKVGAPEVFQSQYITFVGESTATRISYIAALTVEGTPPANAQITAGGIYTNNVTIRLWSTRGGRYDVLVEIWGR